MKVEDIVNSTLKFRIDFGLPEDDVLRIIIEDLSDMDKQRIAKRLQLETKLELLKIYFKCEEISFKDNFFTSKGIKYNALFKNELLDYITDRLEPLDAIDVLKDICLDDTKIMDYEKIKIPIYSDSLYSLYIREIKEYSKDDGGVHG